MPRGNKMIRKDWKFWRLHFIWRKGVTTSHGVMFWRASGVWVLDLHLRKGLFTIRLLSHKEAE